MKTNSNYPYTYSSNGTSVYPISADYSNGTYVNRYYPIRSDYSSGTSVYPLSADYSNGTNVNRDYVMSGTCIPSDSSNGTCGYPITSDYSSGGYYPYTYPINVDYSNSKAVVSYPSNIDTNTNNNDDNSNDPFILNYLNTANNKAIIPNYYSTGTSINPKHPSNIKDVIPYSMPTSVNPDYPYTDPINAEIQNYILDVLKNSNEGVNTDDTVKVTDPELKDYYNVFPDDLTIDEQISDHLTLDNKHTFDFYNFFPDELITNEQISDNTSPENTDNLFSNNKYVIPYINTNNSDEDYTNPNNPYIQDYNRPDIAQYSSNIDPIDANIFLPYYLRTPNTAGEEYSKSSYVQDTNAPKDDKITNYDYSNTLNTDSNTPYDENSNAVVAYSSNTDTNYVLTLHNDKDYSKIPDFLNNNSPLNDNVINTADYLNMDNSRAVVPNYYSTGTSINPNYSPNSKAVVPIYSTGSINPNYYSNSVFSDKYIRDTNYN